MPLKLKIFFFLIFIYFVTAQELDDDITLEKKPLVILPAKNHYHKDVADKIVAIISNQAVSVGRFNVIDRNIVNDILTEQKFQLTGMVDDDQVIEIGNLASAKEALVLDIIHFNQKGVPKEKEEKEDEEEHNTLFTWIVKTLVKETIENSREPDSTQLENNIHTEFMGKVTMINLVTGVSEYSFNLNAEFTGGNRATSLSKVLDQVTNQIRMKLKDLYMITSEIVEINGSDVTILSGENLGLKKGAMFEISSKNRTKTYKGKKITIPGKRRGLLRLTNVGPDASQGKIVRKWRPIKSGHRAYELKRPAQIADVVFSYYPHNKYQLGGRFWIAPFNDLSASINLLAGSVRDSRNKMDGFIGLGTDITYTIFSNFGVTGFTSLSLPALFPFRYDDDNHLVSSILSDPTITTNLSIQINSKTDIIFSKNYIHSTLHGPWQWRKDTGQTDDDGKSITETEPGVWNDAPPEIELSGSYFSVSLRIFNF